MCHGQLACPCPFDAQRKRPSSIRRGPRRSIVLTIQNYRRRRRASGNSAPRISAALLGSGTTVPTPLVTVTLNVPWLVNAPSANSGAAPTHPEPARLAVDSVYVPAAGGASIRIVYVASADRPG